MLGEHVCKFNSLKALNLKLSQQLQSGASDQQVKQKEQAKIDRNVNNLKFALKNLEFETRQKLQEMSDKLMKQDTVCKKQKSLIESLQE